MAKFRWAYIGSGSIAESTARSILKGNHLITAVYSRNFSKARAFAEKYSSTAYESFDELLDSGNFDALYIATPHTAHVEYAVEALKRKIPVLCEKPVGVTSADVELLIRVAKENNTYFAEAMWTWFSDTALGVKKWVHSSKAGKVNNVEIHYAFNGLAKSKDSRVRNPITAGGALLDIGIYPITYCYNLFGYPDKITCEGEIRDGIDVNEKITLTYGDTVCKLYISFEYLKEMFSLKGTKGRILIPVFHVSPYAMLISKKGIKFTFGKTTYLNEFDRCADEIRKGKKESSYIPFEATLNCMKIMDECRRQMGLVYPFETKE